MAVNLPNISDQDLQAINQDAQQTGAIAIVPNFDMTFQGAITDTTKQCQTCQKIAQWVKDTGDAACNTMNPIAKAIGKGVVNVVFNLIRGYCDSNWCKK